MSRPRPPEFPLSPCIPPSRRAHDELRRAHLLDRSSGSISSIDDVIPEATRGLIDFSAFTPSKATGGKAERPKPVRTVSGKSKRRPLEDRTNEMGPLPSDPVFQVALKPGDGLSVPSGKDIHPSTARPARPATRVFAHPSPPPTLNTFHLQSVVVAAHARPRASLGFPYVDSVSNTELSSNVSVAVRTITDGGQEETSDVGKAKGHLRFPSPHSPPNSPPRAIPGQRMPRPRTPHPSRAVSTSQRRASRLSMVMTMQPRTPEGFLPTLAALVGSYFPQHSRTRALPPPPNGAAGDAEANHMQDSRSPAVMRAQHPDLNAYAATAFFSALALWAINLIFLRVPRAKDDIERGPAPKEPSPVRAMDVEAGPQPADRPAPARTRTGRILGAVQSALECVSFGWTLSAWRGRHAGGTESTRGEYAV